MKKAKENENKEPSNEEVPQKKKKKSGDEDQIINENDQMGKEVQSKEISKKKPSFEVFYNI